jgi:hypothetical protein
MRGAKGRDRVRENKEGRPLSEAPLFGVALSCGWVCLVRPNPVVWFVNAKVSL